MTGILVQSRQKELPEWRKERQRTPLKTRINKHSLSKALSFAIYFIIQEVDISLYGSWTDNVCHMEQ